MHNAFCEQLRDIKKVLRAKIANVESELKNSKVVHNRLVYYNADYEQLEGALSAFEEALEMLELDYPDGLREKYSNELEQAPEGDNTK